MFKKLLNSFDQALVRLLTFMLAYLRKRKEARENISATEEFNVPSKPQLITVSKEARNNALRRAVGDNSVRVTPRKVSQKAIHDWPGRRRVREQFHLAHCCQIHGCNFPKDETCALLDSDSIPYFDCEKGLH